MEVGMRIRLFSRRPLLFGRPKWHFRILASNGEIIAASEEYSRRIDAKATAESLRDNLGNAGEVRDA
jgi:uncharacterized protein YegP (UPF0339 family)